MFVKSCPIRRTGRVAEPYVIRWRGRPVNITRLIESLKKKGMERANRLEGEAREQVLHWATQLVLPAYEEALGRSPGRAVRDADDLPYPRSDIKLAVLLGLMFHDPALLAQSGFLDKLYVAYTRLADFQRIEEKDKDCGAWTPESPAQSKYLSCVRDDHAKLTRELQEFCAWLGI